MSWLSTRCFNKKLAIFGDQATIASTTTDFVQCLTMLMGGILNFPGYQSPVPVTRGPLDGYHYQVVLLDLYELWRLRVEYMPQLQMYEEFAHNWMQSTQCVWMDFGFEESFQKANSKRNEELKLLQTHRMPVEVRLFISWNSDHLQIEISLQFLQLMSQCCLKDICLNNDVLTRGGRTLKCSILRDQLL